MAGTLQAQDVGTWTDLNAYFRQQGHVRITRPSQKSLEISRMMSYLYVRGDRGNTTLRTWGQRFEQQ